MKKKIMTASVVVFMLFVIMDYVIHGIFLRSLYEETALLWRDPEAIGSLLWIYWVVDAFMAFLMVWIFAKGWEAGKPWFGQGLRFGLTIGLLFSLPMGFSMYAMMPIPFVLGLGWFVGGLVTFMVGSIGVARVFRP